MRYRVAIHRSDEGYSVSVPGLPGCWSQGTTEAEALDNIRDAIREYLSVVEDQLDGEDVRPSASASARPFFESLMSISVMPKDLRISKTGTPFPMNAAM